MYFRSISRLMNRVSSAGKRGRPQTGRKGRPGFKPSLEAFEDRLVPSGVTSVWLGTVSKLWSVAGNWNNGIIPGAGDTAVIDNRAVRDPTVDANYAGTLGELDLASSDTRIL